MTKVEGTEYFVKLTGRSYLELMDIDFDALKDRVENNEQATIDRAKLSIETQATSCAAVIADEDGTRVGDAEHWLDKIDFDVMSKCADAVMIAFNGSAEETDAGNS